MMDHTRKGEGATSAEASPQRNPKDQDESIMREDTPTPFSTTIYNNTPTPSLFHRPPTTKVPAIDDDDDASDVHPLIPPAEPQSRR